MGKIIAVGLRKGGVGKTTTVVNLGVILAQKHKKKVLLVDMDPQGHVSLSMRIRPNDLKRTIYDVFTGDSTVNDVLLKTDYKVDMLPANKTLAQFDMLIMDNRDANNPALWLKEILEPLQDRYDYIILDLPPSLSWLTINALAAAHELIIPMQAELFAESGVSDLMESVADVQKTSNPGLKIAGILLTMFNARTNLSSIVSQDIRKFAASQGIRVFTTSISRSVRFGEANLMGKPAVIHAPSNEAVGNYVEFVKEMLVDG
jgi:chromosome partitioning protein